MRSLRNKQHPELSADPARKPQGAMRAPVPPRPGMSVVEFRNVSKRYGNIDAGLLDASFEVQRGEFVFLVGQTGSGKSTIMRLLIKELELTDGTIRVAGRDLETITRKKVPYYRRNIGVVFQDFKLLPDRTVYENVAYALQVIGAHRKEIRSKVPDILRLTGLSTKLHNYPHQLSGGEQQRVSIARAFVNAPPLLLCDEPTGNLDPETSIGIMQLLYRINRAGATVLVATHDHAMVDKMRRRVIELEKGRVIRDEAAGAYTFDETTKEFAARLSGDVLERHTGEAPTPSGRTTLRGARSKRLSEEFGFEQDEFFDDDEPFVDEPAPAERRTAPVLRDEEGGEQL